MMRYGILLLCFCLYFNGLHAQQNSVPVLEREISVDFDHASLQVVLDTISAQAGFVFSYNPDVIQVNRIVSIHVSHKPVRYVLNVLFNGEVTGKVRGKYVILQRGTREPSSNRKHIVEGYVYDSGSGKKIASATVYDRDHLLSSITDKYGYFKLEIPDPRDKTEIYFSKEGYLDTLFAPHPVKSHYVTIELSKDKTGLPFMDSLATGSERKDEQITPPPWLIPKRIRINAGNLTDTLFRNVQFSILPFLGTNKLLTGNVTNSVSVNLTVGYVQGVRIAEVGGIMNIVRNNAGVCQVAGAGNIVGHSFHGFQAAGVWNIDKTIDGIQAAGAINIVRKNAGICQIAGAGNIVGDSLKGVQLAGGWNHTKVLEGIQIAGALNSVSTNAGFFQLAGAGNLTRGSFMGVQTAGLFNSSGNMEGIQIAGGLNTAKKINGLQVAGAINHASEVTGGQVSGLLNTATVVTGFQLSVINIADSCKGTPVGVFSIVKKGYFKTELSADELFYTNLAVRTGIRRFHNILLAGFRPTDFTRPLWTFGYGIGTTFGMPDRILYDIDISAQQIIRGTDFREKNQLYKFYLGIDKEIYPAWSVAVGITGNFYVSQPGLPDYETNYGGIIPYTFVDKTFSNGTSLKCWSGIKLAVRFSTNSGITN